jgi:hypothetical protein
VGGEGVAQDRQEVDLAQSGLGLGAADVDAPIGEIDVAPEQVAELFGARAGEEERGDDRHPALRAPLRAAVEQGAGVKQRLDLLDGVEVDRSVLGLGQAAPSPFGGGSASARTPARVMLDSALHLEPGRLVRDPAAGERTARGEAVRDRDPRFPFPHSWKEVTRWWYIHRIVATVGFRFLLAAAIAAVLGQFIGAGEETKIIAGLVLGVFATYVSTLSSAVFQGAQPKLLVGVLRLHTSLLGDQLVLH